VNPTAPHAPASVLDRDDPLADLRREFHIPEHDGDEAVYLCGNSLGLQPVSAAGLLAEELEDWKRLGVEGHFRGRRPWVDYHRQFAAGLAQLTGSAPGETAAMNTLTVNLHLLMVSFYRPTPERWRMLIEKPAFPSDRYAAESQVRFHGFDPADALLEIGPREGESWIREEDILRAIDEFGDTIALVLLPGVQYYSGQVFDMREITGAARAKGCRVGWDLAHAIGNVPLRLHDWGCDFATWCSYKYLNGGPGAVSGIFVHARHAEAGGLPRFAGWWGHDRASRFDMGPEFRPMPGAEGWQLSNPPILSLTPLLASLELFERAGMEALRRKSEQLTGFLEALLIRRLADQARILTPAAPGERGCQLSVSLQAGRDRGREVFAGLSAAGVVCDWREPDVIRVAPVPLYNRYADCERFVEVLSELVGS
jgi:kynureninase